MKKWISLLIILGVLLSTASCVKKTEILGSAGGVTEEKPLGFNAQYVRTDGYQKSAEYPQVAVICSTDQLQAYMEADTVYNLLNAQDFTDACRHYDSAYFAEQSLILIVLQEPSGSNRHKVTGVSLKEKELIIEIDRLVPEMGTDDMAQWHIMVELQAGISVSDPESVTVMIDGENATDPVIPTEYTSGYAYMDLDLPKGWAHELIEDDGSASGFGLRFWPEGQKDGKIYVSYQKNGFGVCGTGLETKEITLGTHKASQGTYDEKKVWDYIWLKDTAGDYVIYNEGAESWWQQYGEEAMEILDTLMVGKECIAEEKALSFAKEKCTMEYHSVYSEFLYRQGAWKFTFRNNNTSETQEIIVENSGKVASFLYHQAN